jgi:hypothetical protein
VSSLEKRLEGIERLVEGRVEARVREEELEAAFDRLQGHLTRDEVIRVARILADEEVEPGQ